MNTFGWKSVFSFTFVQTAKSKAFKVSSVIIITLVFAMALLAGVLPALTPQGCWPGLAEYTCYRL